MISHNRSQLNVQQTQLPFSQAKSKKRGTHQADRRLGFGQLRAPSCPRCAIDRADRRRNEATASGFVAVFPIRIATAWCLI
jgi:hypothetical protein